MTDRVCRRKFCPGFACATLSTFLHAGNSDTNSVTIESVTKMNKSLIGNFRFIDLFCGIGGFHQAMSELGGKCVFSCDIDADCRKTYQRNYGLEPVGDITKVEAKEIPPHDVLCAGFPCQAFSKAGNRLGFADKTKGTLFFFYYTRYVSGPLRLRGWKGSSDLDQAGRWGRTEAQWNIKWRDGIFIRVCEFARRQISES